MIVKCYFRDCQNEWEYNGKAKFYITCSKCLRKLSIDKLKGML